MAKRALTESFTAELNWCDKFCRNFLGGGAPAVGQVPAAGRLIDATHRVGRQFSDGLVFTTGQPACQVETGFRLNVLISPFPCPSAICSSC